MKFFVAICAIIVATNAIKLPPNFKTCNRKQANFRGCLLEAARFGVTQLNKPYPELKMISLDPLVIPKIEASIESQLVNITSELTNCTFYQVLQLDIQKFDIDFEEKTIQLAANWPELKSECFTQTSGHILRNVADSESVSASTFKNFRWTFDLTYEEVKKKNKTYVKAVTSQFDGKPELVTMETVNLKKGDQELITRLTKTINDNWSDLYDDVKGAYLERAKTMWLQIMNGWFEKLSLEEAFDN